MIVRYLSYFNHILKKTIKEILNESEHRPWPLPAGMWKYYQEWNNAVFLHWRVNVHQLKQFVPDELKIDLFQGRPWVSLVAFTMEKIRPRNLPAFSPISNFHEINVRTYVKYENKLGVYFLSIEGGNRVSCRVANVLSDLPYRFSKMKRQRKLLYSENSRFKEKLKISYEVGNKITTKTEIEKWLIERYLLLQEKKSSISKYEIHHIEWPTFEMDLKQLDIEYPRFEKLLNNVPELCHYSPGVQVIAWGK